MKAGTEFGKYHKKTVWSLDRSNSPNFIIRVYIQIPIRSVLGFIIAFFSFTNISFLQRLRLKGIVVAACDYKS